MDDEETLIVRLRGGEDDVFGALFEMHRMRLRRMVQFRIDSRLLAC